MELGKAGTGRTDYQENNAPLGPAGYARIVAAKDDFGGRYVSNLADLQVGTAPSNPSQSEWTVERFRKAKYAIAGTVDQVKRKIEQLRTLGGEGDLEWFGWFFDQGIMPWEEEIRQIELFAEHIIPAFR
jgi:hypothetical protein